MFLLDETTQMTSESIDRFLISFQSFVPPLPWDVSKPNGQGATGLTSPASQPLPSPSGQVSSRGLAASGRHGKRTKTGGLYNSLRKHWTLDTFLGAGAEETVFKEWQITRHMLKMKPTNLICSDLHPSSIWGWSWIVYRRKESTLLPSLRGLPVSLLAFAVCPAVSGSGFCSRLSRVSNPHCNSPRASSGCGHSTCENRTLLTSRRKPNSFTSLSLHFLTCQMGLLIPTSSGCFED